MILKQRSKGGCFVLFFWRFCNDFMFIKIVQKWPRHCERCFLIVSLFLLFLFPLPIYGKTSISHVPTLLVLHSYHEGYPWSDGLTDGIMKTFSQWNSTTRIFVEYLDAKRSVPGKYIAHFENTLRLKYQNIPLDAILCCDDEAFSFLAHSGKRLFGEIPFIFCGVNSRNFSPDEIGANTTGIIERVDIEGTLRLALRFYPYTRHIAVISDLSPTAMSIISLFRQSIIPFSVELEEIDLLGFSHKELEKALKSLPSQTIVLLLQFSSNGEEEYMSPAEVISFIQQATDSPIFSFWDIMIEAGALAGSVLQAKEHGREAATLAIQALEGTPPSDIPIREDSPIFMVNYPSLESRSLSLRDVPYLAVFVNEPQSFLYKYRRVIAISAAITTILFILALALFWNDRQLKIEMEALRSETELLEKLFENAPHGTILTDCKGRIVRANRVFLRMFGYKLKEVLGQDADLLLTDSPDLLKNARELSEVTVRGGVISEKETYRVRKNGVPLPVLISTYPLVVDGLYRGCYGIYSDNTASKKREEAVREHLRMEEIVASTSAHLVSEDPFEQTVLAVLHEVWQITKTRYMAFFFFDTSVFDRGIAYVRHRDAKEGGGESFPLTFDEVEPLKRVLSSQTMLCFGEEYPFYWSSFDKNRIFKPYPKESVYMLPILCEDEVAGCLTCASCWEGEAKNSVKNLLEIVALLLGAALSRRKTNQLFRDNILLLEKTFQETFHLMGRLLEIKDPYTVGHQQNVAILARFIGRALHLSSFQVDSIYYAALVHDIGKIPIPSSILSKPGSLNAAEFAIIKEHAHYGADILSSICFPWPIADIVRQHHERFDGSGYPCGLKGDEIRLEARIISVADVVEAMSSFRPYRPALGVDAALREIQEHRGDWFDPQVVDTCIDVFARHGNTIWDNVLRSSIHV